MTGTAIASSLQKLGSMALKNGGVITNVESKGVKALPQPMRIAHQKHTKGHLVNVAFRTSPDVVTEMHRLMNLDTSILRFMVTKVASSTKPFPVERAKGELPRK
eukprot:CAMPEP_0113901452 /NCGR_PEP_ID=MMETSP0780_2-20120614/21257_1 /TAXON_ID=652834 /ORGANISM="Palpitomonas bilix" /LENGTH=103 /DNA_ID=CAMNT_0000894057 /DNA_START=84 /DNA_END=395 /DNA_ORIENTATION=- /assembly_acc=CAM_ASM_000599